MYSWLSVGLIMGLRQVVGFGGATSFEIAFITTYAPFLMPLEQIQTLEWAMTSGTVETRCRV